MRTAVLAATAVAACVVSAGARADVVSSTATLATFDFYSGGLLQDLPAFDITLGTLTSITVNTRASLSDAVQVQPAFGTALPFIGTFNVQFDAQVFGSPRADRDTLVQTVSTPLDASGRGVVMASVNTSFTIPAADWPGNANPFGDTPLTLSYDFIVTPQGGLSYPFDGAHSILAGGSVSVSYTYTAAGAATSPVPEPASLTLLAAGVLGATAWRRRV